MIRPVAFSACFLLALACFPQHQEKIDSLQQQLSLVKEDSVKISLLLELSKNYRKSDLNKAAAYARKAYRLSEEKTDIQGKSLSLFYLGFAYFQKAAYTEALKHYEEALAIAQEHHLLKEALNILLNIGIIYDLRNDNQKAFEIYQQVWQRADSAGNQQVATGALQNLAILHIKQSRYDEALQTFLKVLPVFEQLHLREDIAKTSLNIGNLYGILHDFDSSLAYLHKALEMQEKEEDQPGIAQTLYNIGATYQDLGNSKLAEEYYTKSLTIQQALGNQRGISYNLYALATIYSEAGNYEKAVDFFRQGIQSFDAIGFTDQKASCYSGMGLALRALGKNQEARENFVQALQIKNEVGDLPGKANALHHLGIMYLDSKNYSKAAHYLNKAYEINQQLDDSKAMAMNLYYMGSLYEAQGNADQALDYYHQATYTYLEVYPNGKFFKLAQAYDKISQEYLKKDSLKLAYTYNQQALMSLMPEGRCSLPDTCWRLTLNGLELLKVLKTRAGILNTVIARHPEQADTLRAALQVYFTALDLVDSLRGHYRTASERALMEHVANLYEGSLHTIHSLYQITGEKQWIDQAFAVMERYRNHRLKASLGKSQQVSYAGVPDSLQEKENALKMEIAFYQEQLLNEKSGPAPGDSAKINLLSRKVFEKTNQYEALLSNLKNTYPSYYNLKFKKALLPLAHIQEKLLKEDQVLLEYFTGDTVIYLLAVSRDKTSFKEIAYDSVLQHALYRFHTLLSSPGSEKDFQDYVRLAQLLYRQLVAPASLNTEEDHAIMIIPDGILGNLPFESLIHQAPEPGSSYKDLAYLIRDHEISYHYSATLLANEHPKSSAPSYTFVGFAPTFSNNTDQQLLAFHETVRSYMDSARALPFAEEEVDLIATLLKGHAYLGSQATEQNFKRNAADARIIHLASHSLVNDTDPLYSKLIFDAEHDSLEDGLLHTYELYNMQLNADLVCLSACNTGVGKFYKGEGIVSLARGFMYAGVPNLLMSLWSVPDRPTKDIMQVFYQVWKNGGPYASSLRAAKLRYLEQADNITAHPYYWGAFIYLGQTTEDPGQMMGNFWLGIGIALTLLLITIAGITFLKVRLL